jgi:hypothetical protein
VSAEIEQESETPKLTRNVPEVVVWASTKSLLQKINKPTKHVSLVVAFINKIFDFFLLLIIKIALIDYYDS